MIKKCIYVGRFSFMFKQGERILVKESENGYTVIANEDGTGWICNIAKHNFKEM